MDANEKLDVNAVCLRNAVLCADCEFISDSAHETCRVCGSHSLLSLSRVLGTLPMQRAHIVESKPERLPFSVQRRMPHRRARRAVA
jgi:anaerobic ribonucleoside-triphosphate reductase